MKKLLLLLALVAALGALAGGVVHVVEVDDASGDVVFAPHVDQAALAWWTDRAQTVVERASTEWTRPRRSPGTRRPLPARVRRSKDAVHLLPTGRLSPLSRCAPGGRPRCAEFVGRARN